MFPDFNVLMFWCSKQEIFDPKLGAKTLRTPDIKGIHHNPFSMKKFLSFHPLLCCIYSLIDKDIPGFTYIRFLQSSDSRLATEY